MGILAAHYPSEVSMKSFLMLVALIALVSPALAVQSGRKVAQAETAAPKSVASGVDEAAIKLKTMPEISLKQLDGKTVETSELKGNIVVLDFWATWCGPCITEIPHYNKLQEKYAAKGLKVVGVTMASGEAKEVKPFVTRHNMKYAIFMGDDSQAYDFNIVGFPTTYLLTKDWKIYRKYVGAGPRKTQQLEEDIKKLLEQ